jgi:hypothetical protein
VPATERSASGEARPDEENVGRTLYAMVQPGAGMGAIPRHQGKTAMAPAGAEQTRRASARVGEWIGGSDSATVDRLGQLVEAAALERRVLLRVNR